MKKILFVLSLVSVFAFVNVASAFTQAEYDALMAQVATLTAKIAAMSAAPAASNSSIPTITKTLTIGSRGTEVEALQQYLIDEGLLDYAGTLGYFGNLTKAAVVEWQKANDVTPASGLFGPISRAALAALAEAAPVVVTPGTTPAPVGLDQTDGSITAGDAAIVSTGATFKKGETRNIYDVRLQATGGKVAVTRLDVKFSEKPYLTLNKLVLKDSAGTVIAEKTLSSMADVTEVTVGSDYRVRFENFSYVVTPGTDSNLVVSATAMAASDKIGTQTVTLSIPTGGIRTLNGRGYTDSLGGITAKTFTFSSTGSIADLNSTISSASPAKRNVTTSATTEIPNVVLGVYRLKAVNADATISSLSVMLKSSTGVATSTLLNSLRLVDADGKEYGAASLTAGQTFTNLTIKLPKDTWTDLTLKANINSNQSLSASTTLDVSTIVANDSNDNTMTLTNASDVTAYDVVFSTGALDLVGPLVIPGTAIAGYTQGLTTNQNVTYVFSLKNNSNNVLFASSTVAQLVATSTAGSAGAASVASSTIQSITASSASGVTPVANAAGNYSVNPGETVTFSLQGLVSKNGGSTAYSELKITGINYGSATAVSTLNFGLEALKYGLAM